MAEREKKELTAKVSAIPHYTLNDDGSLNRGAAERQSFIEEHPSQTAEADIKGVQFLFRVGLRFRKLISSVTIFFVVLAAIYSLLATRMFTAESTLRIGTYSPMIPGAELENMLRQQTREQDYINTQIELLSSFSLADRVLSDPEIGPEILSYFERESNFFGVKKIKKLFTDWNSKQPKVGTGDSYRHSVTLLKRYLDLVQVSPLKKTSLVKVSVSSSDPGLSARIANLHGTQFISMIRDERQSSTLESLLFLKNQAQELADKVSNLEGNLAAYAEENSIVSLNKDENVTVKRMAELNTLLTEATSRRIKSETLFKEANSAAGLDSAAFDDRSILDLRVALKQAESEYSQLAEKFKPTYPAMAQLGAKIKTYKENLDQQRRQVTRGLEATTKADLQAEQELQQLLEQQQSKAFELSRREVKYNVIKRDLESSRDLHQAVLRQLKESQVSAESSSTNISLSDRAALPLKPSSPKPMQNVLLALILGLALGSGTALAIELLDNTFGNPEDLQRCLGLPVLGVVPIFALDNSVIRGGEEESKTITTDIESANSENKSIQVPAVANSKIITLNPKASVASEAFRSVRTGILLSSADNPPRVVLVTSGKKSEGKTTLAINLAAALSQSAFRTVLIDADLRRPAVHKSFEFGQRGPGLVDYLTGQVDLNEIISETDSKSLYCITAGSIPPNPAELVGSKKMAEMLRKLSQDFDYVIVDAPPILPVTDAVLLSRVVDGVVLVVRGEDTPKHVAREARERLRQAGARMLGVVLNDVNFRRWDYYYYYRDSYSYYEPDVVSRKNRRRAGTKT